MPEISRREAMFFAAATAAMPLSARAAEPAPSAEWDLGELYPSDAAWTAERDAVETALPSVAPFRGRLGESAATLGQALTLISGLQQRAARLQVYANLKSDADLTVAANQERRQLGTALYGKLSEATAWVDPEILAVGEAKILGFIAADPGLSRFAFGLKNTLRQAPHTLDAAQEALLASATQVMDAPRSVRSQLFLSDLPWAEATFARGKVRVDPQAYELARSAPDRAERKLAMDAFFGAMGRFESSLGATLSAQVQTDIFRARARKYGSAVEAALSIRNVPVAVYRTMLAEAERGLPVLHRYFELRRRMLGLPDLAYYDIYPPLTRLDRRFDLAEMRRLSLEAVKPLGPDYGDTLAKATLARWMDASPRKGKYAGAYMQPGAYEVHPYLLLNLHDDYDSLTAFVHEWGHAMHSVLAVRSQPYETSEPPIFLAEIASTLNEQLLVDLMLRQAKTKEEKLFYLSQLCELLRATFFRQAMFAEFELAIHETAERGEALSGKKMTAIYLGLMKKYHGPGMAIDPAYAIEWAYPQHFFMRFYVFQYATCMAASAYFADRVLTGKPAERDAYLGVLKAGASDYPADILRRAGVDLTTPAPYQALVAKLGRTMDQMEALLGKA